MPKPMLNANLPALVLAPMDGITDAPMRALQGAYGAFSFAVSEFVRVSGEPLPAKVFLREVPELSSGAATSNGLPVQVQILGGEAEPMAASAAKAVQAGANAIDINFGCPAPIVNRHDGGASLLRYPCRIESLVRAVRDAVPSEIPVSAKLRLGWDGIDAIFENAAMAQAGGASWITIHARTRVQGYQPPVYWPAIGQVREQLNIPVVANGDIWTIEDFHRCQLETGCLHYMLGRGALADPTLSHQIAARLGLSSRGVCTDHWPTLLGALISYADDFTDRVPHRSVMRLKQWLKIASNFGRFPHFDAVKHSVTVEEFFQKLATAEAAAA